MAQGSMDIAEKKRGEKNDRKDARKTGDEKVKSLWDVGEEKGTRGEEGTKESEGEVGRWEGNTGGQGRPIRIANLLLPASPRVSDGKSHREAADLEQRGEKRDGRYWERMEKKTEMEGGEEAMEWRAVNEWTERDGGEGGRRQTAQTFSVNDINRKLAED